MAVIRIGGSNTYRENFKLARRLLDDAEKTSLDVTVVCGRSIRVDSTTERTATITVTYIETDDCLVMKDDHDEDGMIDRLSAMHADERAAIVQCWCQYCGANRHSCQCE